MHYFPLLRYHKLLMYGPNYDDPLYMNMLGMLYDHCEQSVNYICENAIINYNSTDDESDTTDMHPRTFTEVSSFWIYGEFIRNNDR